MGAGVSRDQGAADAGTPKGGSATKVIKPLPAEPVVHPKSSSPGLQAAIVNEGGQSSVQQIKDASVTTFVVKTKMEGETHATPTQANNYGSQILGTTSKPINDVVVANISMRVSFLSMAGNKDIEDRRGQDSALKKALPAIYTEMYGLNIYEIDAQHFKLLEIINSYIKLREHEYAGAQAVIAACIDYTRYHFETEERLLDLVEWPNAKEHKLEHKEFVDRCMEVMYQFEFHNLQQMDAFGFFLKEWLITHIKGTDKQYADWLFEPQHSSMVQRLVDNGVIMNFTGSS